MQTSHSTSKLCGRKMDLSWWLTCEVVLAETIALAIGVSHLVRCPIAIGCLGSRGLRFSHPSGTLPTTVGNSRLSVTRGEEEPVLTPWATEGPAWATKRPPFRLKRAGESLHVEVRLCIGSMVQ
jgi:hypothetical protein